MVALRPGNAGVRVTCRTTTRKSHNAPTYVGRGMPAVPERPQLDGPDRHRHAVARPGDGRAAPREPRHPARAAGGRVLGPARRGTTQARDDAGPRRRRPETVPATSDIVTKTSPRPVADTVAGLARLLETKGLKVFAVIDQRAEARAVGLELRETTLVIFGNPAAGTGVMDAVPLAALDLPLKVLVWADADGATDQLRRAGRAGGPLRADARAGRRLRRHPCPHGRPRHPLNHRRGLCTRCPWAHPVTGYPLGGVTA